MKRVAFTLKMFAAAAGVLFFAWLASANAPPKPALEYIPVLRAAQEKAWPDAPMRSFIAAQIEQESCIALTHPKCWNPRAELKTKREYGFGFGQITRAYNADSSIRFDKFSELQRQYVSLRDWTWSARYDPSYQLTALVEMDHGLYRRVAGAASDLDRVAFTLSGYNGGESGVRQDRLLCSNTERCDQSRWFDHVAAQSVKRKQPYPGYRLSPFDINREYVDNIINRRRDKYVPFFEG